MKNSLFIILVLAVVFAGSQTASACVCAGEESIGAAFNHADAVFSAEYLGAEYRKGIVNELREMQKQIDGGKAVEYEVLVLKFRVEEWWKGGTESELILLTDNTRGADGTESISDCEYVFSKKGEKFLIYAYGKSGALSTGACTRTAKLKNAKKDLKILGTGNKVGKK